MTPSARILLGASLAACLAAAPALAQSKPPAPPAKAAAPAAEAKGVALTQAQIDGILAAQPELAKLSGGSSDQPDPKVQTEAEAIVKRNGFANLDAFQDATETVDTVLEGVDPQTKGYVGVVPLLKKQLAGLEADKAMPAKEKAAAVKEVKAAIAAGEPGKPSEANIALVTKNYDRLSAALGPDDDGKEAAEAGKK